MKNLKVLLVDDEEAIIAALEEYLSEQGFDVDTALNGDTALQKYSTFHPDVILLDVRMPGMDGLKVCEIIRKKDLDVVLILVTAVDTDISKVKALNFGADDYITKPFSTLEVEARIKAHMRRVNPAPGRRKELQQFGSITVDLLKREIIRNSELVKCTQKEFDLLCYFMEHPGEAIDRFRFLEDVWGHEQYPTTRTVDIHVMQLRKKLEDDPSQPRHFLTVHGIGYRFEP